MTDKPPDQQRARVSLARWLSDGLFSQIEHFVYVAIGALLAVTAGLALLEATVVLWHGLIDWSGSQAVFEIVDQLLFVLMLIEILHTVRASIRTGTLTAEPFLIVGLIASIRRVLVITLESSEAMRRNEWAGTIPDQFRATMIELAILGGLILIMVISIYLLHRSEKLRNHPDEP